jgi:hypothetical protein
MKTKNTKKGQTTTRTQTLDVVPRCCVCFKLLVCQENSSFLSIQKFFYCNNEDCKHFGLLTVGFKHEK